MSPVELKELWCVLNCCEKAGMSYNVLEGLVSPVDLMMEGSMFYCVDLGVLKC